MSEIFPVIVSPAVYFMLVRFSFKTVSVWNQERGDWRYDRQSLVHISDINIYFRYLYIYFRYIYLFQILILKKTCTFQYG